MTHLFTQLPFYPKERVAEEFQVLKEVLFDKKRNQIYEYFTRILQLTSNHATIDQIVNCFKHTEILLQ
jgi:hypothetical protein